MSGNGHKPVAREKILLVNANNLGLRARQVVLEELGYSVTALNCSLKALETFCSEEFELVVTDYRMPRLNGIELIQRIREKDPRMPVVLISGVADTLGLDQMNTGADIVIQKSAHEETTLTRAVVRLLAPKLPRKTARKQMKRSAAGAHG